MLSISDVLKVIPHRYPFLLVDRVLELEAGRRAVGIKLVSANEPYFQGHFPGMPIMPGVLIVEALAQVGAVAVLSQPQFAGKVAYFAGIDAFRFKAPVFPGDVLRLEVTLQQMRGAVGKGTGVATVDGKVVAKGDLLFAVGDPPSR
jgi:3-hydroxyacyl-[acyl-carrier-protein] dehydratase